MLNNYADFIHFYTEDPKGTGYLAFRDLHQLLNPAQGRDALDFGCGAGRSSRYLERLGFHVTGVDINDTMIEKAKSIESQCHFFHMPSNLIPFSEEQFDIVFNSFVLFDVPTKNEMITHFNEMKRVCKKKGSVISIVNSDYLFTQNWLTVKNNFPQNRTLQSGDIARLYLSHMDVDIYDYYWTSKDYEQCFKAAGFRSIKRDEPLGTIHDPYDWIDELSYPPYSIYICEV